MFTELEVFEDSKVVIRIRKSKKDRSHNGQKKKYKRTNNDLQNIQIKLKTGGEFRCSEEVSRSCSTSDTRRANLLTNSVIRSCKSKRDEPCILQ